MSLKSFHLFVGLLSVVGCCAYAMWSVLSFLRDGDVTRLLIAVPLLILALALLMNSVIFYKRTEEEPWL